MSAQERFDKTYISSTQIMRELGVSRTAILHARKRGFLPDAVTVNDGQLMLWERDTVKPYLDAWTLTLGTRRKAA